MNLETFGFSEAIAFVAVVVAFYYGWQNSKLTQRLLVKEAGEAISLYTSPKIAALYVEEAQDGLGTGRI